LHSLLNLHKLSLTLVSASVSMRVFAGTAEWGRFSCSPSCRRNRAASQKRKCATRRLIARLGVKKSSLCNGLRIPSQLCCSTCFQEEFLQRFSWVTSRWLLVLFCVTVAP